MFKDCFITAVEQQDRARQWSPRDYELLTLHGVRKPSTPAYICRPDYHYIAAERVFKISYHHRAASLGDRDPRTMASLNNWITTLIKLKEYGVAAEVCRKMVNTLQDRGGWPYFIIMKCNLAACLVLSKQRGESSQVLHYLRERHMWVQFDIVAEAYFEALSMTCRTGRDCMVLRESDDQVPGLVRINDYKNTFSPRLSNTVNSHKVKQFLDSLHRTASQLLKSSQIDRLAPNTVSLGTDVPQKADARLDSFVASTSPADRKSLAALVNAFGFEVDEHATEQQVAENSSKIVRPDIPRPPIAQAAARPPVIQSSPESQVPRAHRWPPLDQELLGSRVSQAAPKPRGIGMIASGPSHRPSQIRTEATLKPQVDASMFAQRPEQHNKQLMSNTTVNSSKKPQATDRNLEVETWLEHQKTNPPIPDMLPTGGASSSPVDAMIGLTYRTNDTIGSSQVADIKPENLLPVTAWSGCSTAQIHNPKQIKVLLDDGASKNCVSEEFCEAINAQIDTGRTVDLKGPDGRRLQVLGRVTVAFSWEGPSGTKIKKIPCYVVNELEIAMLICHAYILKLELRGSPAMQAPIFSSRTKQEKLDDEKRSRDIAAAAKVREELEEARRKADRKKLEDSHLSTPNLKSSGTIGSFSSLIGGSNTTAPSRSSSIMGSNSSITGQNTPQSQVCSSFSP